jgi:hypothetical protein
MIGRQQVDGALKLGGERAIGPTGVEQVANEKSQAREQGHDFASRAALAENSTAAAMRSQLAVAVSSWRRPAGVNR